MKLSDREWKAFTTNDLFSIISGTVSDFSKLTLKRESKLPCIGAKYKNNGVVGFTDNEELKVKGNAIVFIKTGEGSVGLTVYKAEDFIPHKNVYIGYNQSLNKYVGLFIVAMYNKQKFIYSYGYGLNKLRVERRKILLPSKNNRPDYDFMERYIKEKYFNLKSQIKEKQKHEVSDWRGLDEVEWEDHFIESLFKIKPGKRLTKKEFTKGSKPFIGSSDHNNGVTNFVDNHNSSEDFNVLGVNYNGSVVENFYHPYKALFSDDVKRLSLKINGNRYMYLFIKNMILKQKEKYQYGYKFNSTRMKRQIIKLPTKNNQPDYKFMEQYMKRKENEVLERI
ncbi:restriction endonuclease subunit S [Staphylococcus chromogenes]|nr:restriction endonuclease subunit S [Staphylococcus chromogenes]